MNGRACLRGCVIPGQHFAACPDYASDSAACPGCVAVEARDGALICSRCYGRLQRTLERVPELIEHLRTLTGGIRAAQYDITRRQAAAGHTHAPASPDLLDAYRDIMSTIYSGTPSVTATPAEARQHALGGVGYLLANFDTIANDADSVAQWWQVIVAHEIPTHPEFWTVRRALNRWPLEDRRRWAKGPCPDCDLRAVSVSPPPRAGGAIWYTCTSCQWAGTDADDDGLWSLVLGEWEELSQSVT